MDRDLSEAALEAAEKGLKTLWASRGVTCAAYALYGPKGNTVIKAVPGEGCHYRLRDTYGIIEVAIWVNDGKFNEKYNEACRAFIKWMCSEGPGAPFVLNTDPDEWCDRGVLWDYAHATKHQSFWFAKTLRAPYEENWKPFFWKEYVDRGVNPLVALFACHLLNSAGVCINNGYSTHGQTCGNPANLAELKKLLTIEWTAKTRPNNAVNAASTLYLLCATSSANGIMKIGKSRQEKVADGWGGFKYQTINSSLDDDAKHLIQLTKEALAL